MKTKIISISLISMFIVFSCSKEESNTPINLSNNSTSSNQIPFSCSGNTSESFIRANLPGFWKDVGLVAVSQVNGDTLYTRGAQVDTFEVSTTHWMVPRHLYSLTGNELTIYQSTSSTVVLDKGFVCMDLSTNNFRVQLTVDGLPIGPLPSGNYYKFISYERQ